MSLKGKTILITAGPTWVAIDSVRVISNIATGTTGALLAREAAHQGARVSLVLGSSSQSNHFGKSIRVIHFRFFDELKDILKHELQNKKYDIIIHSAAVSDFKPQQRVKRKLSSERTYGFKLVPLEKLIVLIRRLNRKARLVMFKLETDVQNQTLMKRARQAQRRAGADLVVANSLNPYRALIIDRNGSQVSAGNKQDLAKKLIKILSKYS